MGDDGESAVEPEAHASVDDVPQSSLGGKRGGRGVESGGGGSEGGGGAEEGGGAGVEGGAPPSKEGSAVSSDPMVAENTQISCEHAAEGVKGASIRVWSLGVERGREGGRK